MDDGTGKIQRVEAMTCFVDAETLSRHGVTVGSQAFKHLERIKFLYANCSGSPVVSSAEVTAEVKVAYEMKLHPGFSKDAHTYVAQFHGKPDPRILKHPRRNETIHLSTAEAERSCRNVVSSTCETDVAPFGPHVGWHYQRHGSPPLALLLQSRGNKPGWYIVALSDDRFFIPSDKMDRLEDAPLQCTSSTFDLLNGAQQSCEEDAHRTVHVIWHAPFEAIPVDQWLSLEWRVRWSTYAVDGDRRLTDGAVKVDIHADGKQIAKVDWTGPVGRYDNGNLPYFKFGTYNSAGTSAKHSISYRRFSQIWSTDGDDAAIPEVEATSAASERLRLVATMATWPPRLAELPAALDSLLHQSVGLDMILVYLNGYKEVPKEWPVTGRVRYLLGEQDLGDLGKFAFVSDGPGGNLTGISMGEEYYHFTVDDDIIYPHDYAEKMLEALQDQRDIGVVGVHGRILPGDPGLKPLLNFPADAMVAAREAFMCLYHSVATRVIPFSAESNRELVHIVGSGTMLYHTGHFQVRFADLASNHRNMADAHLAVLAQQQRIPMRVVMRPRDWLVTVHQSDDTEGMDADGGSIFRDLVSEQSEYQTNLMNTIMTQVPWKLFSELGEVMPEQSTGPSVHRGFDVHPRELVLEKQPLRNCMYYECFVGRTGASLNGTAPLDEVLKNMFSQASRQWGCEKSQQGQVVVSWVDFFSRDQLMSYTPLPFVSWRAQMSTDTFLRVVTPATQQDLASTLELWSDTRVVHVVMPFGNMPADDPVLAQAIKSAALQSIDEKVLWLVCDGAQPPVTSDPVANVLEAVCSNASPGAPFYSKLLIDGLTPLHMVCLRTSAHVNESVGPGYGKYVGFTAVHAAAHADDVIMVADGDDQLTHPDALAMVRAAFDQAGCWFTFGSMIGAFASTQGPLPYTPPRHSRFIFSHPRTFKVSLFNHMSQSDFQDEDGKWLKAISDRGFVYRGLESAGPRRSCYLPEPIYRYQFGLGSVPAMSSVSSLTRKKLRERFRKMDANAPLGSIAEVGSWLG
eukprot:TRINITY_DN26819_c0_g2_i1.p1 TRINITY_DN26819_c0_g2~~TRINITY_DN26819_c0_g2_i1.p1  ORF type:complete len:1168 (+),score=156.49 TRINITY_DN26819_c0_g2_i1:442-3504(+)